MLNALVNSLTHQPGHGSGGGDGGTEFTAADGSAEGDIVDHATRGLVRPSSAVLLTRHPHLEFVCARRRAAMSTRPPRSSATSSAMVRIVCLFNCSLS